MANTKAGTCAYGVVVTQTSGDANFARPTITGYKHVASGGTDTFCIIRGAGFNEKTIPAVMACGVDCTLDENTAIKLECTATGVDKTGDGTCPDGVVVTQGTRRKQVDPRD